MLLALLLRLSSWMALECYLRSLGLNSTFLGQGIQVFGPAHEDELLDSIGLGLLLPFLLRYSPGMLSKVLRPVVAFLRVT